MTTSLQVFASREQKPNPLGLFSSFNKASVFLQLQRLICQVSPFLAISTLHIFLAMDAQLQTSTADRDTCEIHHTQSCSFGGWKRLESFNE